MKRCIAWLLLLCLSLGLLAGCGAAEKTTVTVFAAASLTDTLTELGAQYMEAHPDVRLLFNFDSSGTLKTQIEAGADCDIFISAGQKQMLPEFSDRPFDLLENRVVLAVPEGNPADIGTFDELAQALQDGTVLLAVGNADVPVGQYTQKILACYGLSEEALAKAGVLTYGSNAREVTLQIREAAVDCGIIYETDAFSAGLTVADVASEAMCGKVIYPAAVLNSALAPEAAQAFLDYVTGPAGDAIFEAVGFTPLA